MSGATSARETTLQAFGAVQLPKRVRFLLEGILDIAAPAFERILESSLDDFEQQLFNFAERGCTAAEEARWIDAQHFVKSKRHALMPAMRLALIDELARLREPQASTGAKGGAPGIGVAAALSLATKLDVDETTMVGEMSNRVEMRNNLSLYLLGQRLGVLAAKPGLGSEAMPVGPQAFGRMLRQASQCLELSPEHRRLLFKVTERHIMVSYGELIDATNNYLVKHGILPDFEYMPTRARQKSASAAAAKAQPAPSPPLQNETPAQGMDPVWHDGASRQPEFPAYLEPADPAPPPGPASRGRTRRAPVTWDEPATANAADVGAPGTQSHEGHGSTATPPVGATDADLPDATDLEGAASFDVMRQLLASRNKILAKLKPASARAAPNAAPVPTGRLQDALRVLQGLPLPPVISGGNRVPRSIQHVKQEMMMQLQASSGDQRMAFLNDEDSDVIDLVSMLFDSINKDTKLNSLASQLLEKLQVPLLRVALKDKGFFYQQHHPAKDLLDAIAESGAYWLGDDEADPVLLEKMNSVVDRTVREFDGDIVLFKQLSQDINAHLNLLTHKAEVAERRHVEAARGKERLVHARERAATAVEGLLAKTSLPKFTKALLSEAWTDVLALTDLRHGESTGAWQHQMDVATQLVRAADPTPGKPGLTHVQAIELRKELESSLSQVGYQPDEIEAIAQKLINAAPEKAGDSAGSKELAKRLKSRPHFGVDSKPAKEHDAPLSPEAKARYEHLKCIAFGTWFEFATNQQGDRTRHRLAWYSPTTGHALFVNKRGQKAGEYHLTTLARRMVLGEVSIVEERAGGIIDRAWRSVLSALRSFAGQQATEGAAR